MAYLKISICFKKFRGCWNLPYITDVILMKSDLFKRVDIVYEDPNLDSSLKFAENLRNKVKNLKLIKNLFILTKFLLIRIFSCMLQILNILDI
jgi:hypothetical protein